MAGEQNIRAGGAYVEIGGDNKDLTSKLSLSLSKFKSWADQIRNVGLGLAAALGSVGVLMAKAIGDSSDLEETNSKFDTVFKEHAASARQWSIAYANVVGRSRNQILSFMAESQDLFVPFGFARDAATELSKAVTALATDLASFNNKRDEDALRDVKSALVGETEAVRKYGVVINETTLSQQLLNMGVAGGIKNATETQKVLGRLALIVKGNSDAQGDAIRTSGSWANQQKALAGASTNVLTVIGDQLKNILRPYQAYLLMIVKATGDWLQQHPQLVSGLLKMFAVLAVITGALLVTAAIMYALSSPILIVIGLVLYLADAFGLVDTGVSDVLDSFKGAAETINSIWNILVDNLLKIWESFKTGIVNALDWIATKFYNILWTFNEVWMTMASKIGWVSKFDFENFKAEHAKSNEEFDAGMAKRKNDRMEGLGDKFYNLDLDIDDQKKKVKKGLKSFMDYVPKIPKPNMPNVDELINNIMKGLNPQTPMTNKMGVTGFIGGNAMEQVGAAFGGPNDVGRQQLEQQQNSNRYLREILDTMKKNTPAYG